MDIEHRGAWQNTYTGIQAFPLALTKDMVCLEDIATALANKNRYTAHTRVSVAQHSYAVFLGSQTRAAELGVTLTIAGARRAFFHDASEAYLPDLSYPLKRCAKDHPDAKTREAVPWFLALEDRVQRTILEAFDIRPCSPEEEEIIQEVDRMTTAVEAYVAFKKVHPDWTFLPVSEKVRATFRNVYMRLWDPDLAKRKFTATANLLGIT